MANSSYNYSDETNDAIDRISHMPDDVRVHILSFLRTKEAVRTCVLSKRWIDTWAFVPVLFFDLKGFLPGRNFPNNKIMGYEAKFERFIGRAFQNRKVSRLDKFILFCQARGIERCRRCNSNAVRGCISRALKMKPRIFAVSFCKHKLSRNYAIFTCPSLEDVMVGLTKIDRTFEIAPKSVHLPCLKTLRLVYVTLNHNFLHKLFVGCPVIEELSLHCCNLNASRISSGTLKKLTLWKCVIWGNLQVCTPILIDLEITSDEQQVKNISLKEMESLVNAKIDISSCLYSDGFNEIIGPELLNGISMVKNLDLTLPCSIVKGLLENGAHNLPIFYNLKSLKLGGWFMSKQFNLVAFFLHSPHLQMVVLRPFNCDFWGWFDLIIKDVNQEAPEDVSIKREHLEMVEIRKDPNIGDEHVDRLVNQLRAHVKNIGKIEIV